MWLRKFHLTILMTGLAALAGCGMQDKVAEPAAAPVAADKDGSEALGAPSLTLAAGSGIAEGGISMVGVDSAALTVTVPEGAVVRQVLLYWAGGTTSRSGDNRITLEGERVTGDLIGGPTFFYEYYGDYLFSAYRADITARGLVAPGVNTLTVTDFYFGNTLVDENNGASVLVVWDDGTPAQLALRDGLDMAYFGFPGLLNATVPQVFEVTPAAVDRVADLVILAGSVGENRANRIRVTTSAGDQFFEDPMGGYDGPQWDSLILPVNVPAGAASVTVELISTESYTPLGASLGWVCAALVVREAVVDEGPWTVSGTVYTDTNENGLQDPTELGLPGVVVDLFGAAGTTVAQTALTDAAGFYSFTVGAGSWTVSVDTAAHQEAFNYDLGAWYLATGPLSQSVTVGPDAADRDFGFLPDAMGIVQDIRDETLTTNGFTRETWSLFLRCASHDEQVHDRDGDDGSRGGSDHDGDDGSRGGSDHDGGSRHVDFRGHRVGDSCGCNPDSLRYNADELREFLMTVEGLFLPEPFQFRDGHELNEAYRLLASQQNSLEGRVRQELLATELNYVVGRGIVAQDDLVAAVAAWVESVLVWDEDTGAKAGTRTGALSGALVLLEAVNTGGGGGVDE